MTVREHLYSSMMFSINEPLRTFGVPIVPDKVTGRCQPTDRTHENTGNKKPAVVLYYSKIQTF